MKDNNYFLNNQFKCCVYSDKLLQHIYYLNQNSLTKVNCKQIISAINYIKKYHGKQLRHSNEPYYSHPIEVAIITSEYMFDTKTILAALLHDVLEDTKSYYSQIELLFGSQVAQIVEAISKISCNFLLSKEETFYKINSLKDPKKRAITIKVIDRLHNMRTISYIKSIEKQKRIAKETLQIYIPLAKYANLLSIAEELQELVIKVLNL